MKNNQPALPRIVIAPESSFPIIPSCHSTAAQKIRFQLVRMLNMSQAKGPLRGVGVRSGGREDRGDASLFPMNIYFFLSFDSMERCC